MKKLNGYHIPVLLDEVLHYLAIKDKGVYLDATFGGGGHSRAILEANKTARVIGFDWDTHALDNAEPILAEYPERLQLIWGNFSNLYKLAKKHKIPAADGILADFGTSQHQIFHKEGFSFSQDTPLDMRMSNSHFQTTAATVVNYGTEKELCEIFWMYGEERHAKAIVRAIVEHRTKKLFVTTHDLSHLIEKVVGFTKGKIHPATRVFQALRIFVNKELENITSFLPAAFAALKPGGRLVCISFHSLEDRIVKNFFKEMIDTQKGTLIEKKVVTATALELKENNAARSAKLRVIEKK